MATKYFSREAITFRYEDTQTGSIPLIFQHGIGGNLENIVSLFKFPENIRLISLDSRGHGETIPVGDLSHFNLYTLVDDIMALMDELHLQKVWLGGMSMGAALAMNAAIRFPERLKGIIIYRPAWLDGGMPSYALSLYEQIVALLRGFGPDEGKKRFLESEAYKTLLGNFPDTAKSMAAQFMAKKALENVIRFEKLPYQKVVHDISEISRIALPSLIISTKLDPVHPFEYGKCIASLIPHSTFMEATPKSVSAEKHIAESQESITSFLLNHEP